MMNDENLPDNQHIGQAIFVANLSLLKLNQETLMAFLCFTERNKSTYSQHKVVLNKPCL